jgi:hypothetical protein
VLVEAVTSRHEQADEYHDRLPHPVAYMGVVGASVVDAPEA